MSGQSNGSSWADSPANQVRMFSGRLSACLKGGKFQLVVPVSHKLLHSVAARSLSSSNGCAAVPFKLVRLAW